MSVSDTPIPDLSHLSTEEKLEQERLWKEELATIEDEISTLRTVLASKMRRCAELKRNLGITVWKEVSEDINQGIKNVKESNVYVFWFGFRVRLGCSQNSLLFFHWEQMLVYPG